MALSTEEIISRYTRNQRDPAVVVGGNILNSAVLRRREGEEQGEEETADSIKDLNEELALRRKAYASISDHVGLWGGIKIDLSNISSELEKMEKRQQVRLDLDRADAEKAGASEGERLEILKRWQKIEAQAANNIRLLNSSEY